AAIDRVDRAVGGDPYLLVLRGNALTEAGRFDQARAALDKALEQEPGLKQAYWGWVTVSLRDKKYGDALGWLKKPVEKFRIQVNALPATPEPPDCGRPPESGQWQDWYRQHKPQ